MNDRKESMKRYFAKETEKCTEKSRQLRMDSREDESVFARIEGNVYGVFQAVFAAACGKEKTDEAIAAFYLERMNQIPQSWHTAYEQAKAHGEADKMLIEQIKMDTAERIRNEFLHIWEGEA